MSINAKLGIIQVNLKAPKNQFNNFGKYAYRSCEDILEAVKPLLSDSGCTLTIADEIISVADRIYVKAIAKLTEIETGESIEVSACAREADDKRGMDPAQLTGATSSYARKYALGGLFALDDTKDADATNDHKGKAMANKANAAGIGEQIKEYKCCDCGKEFKEYTDKNGKTWTAGQVYHMSESNNTDGKARCSACMKKAGTQKQKG